MKVSERTRYSGLPKYYASFENVEVKDGGMLCSAFGDGESENEAMQAYMCRISEKPLVVNAYTQDQRVDIQAPEFASFK